MLRVVIWTALVIAIAVAMPVIFLAVMVRAFCAASTHANGWKGSF